MAHRHLLGCADCSALAPVLYAVTGSLVTDRTMAEQGDGSAHIGGDEDNDDDGAIPRTQ